MAAIITDQLRIVNASNFVAGVQSSANSYYAFIGLPNAGNYSSTWDSDPPAPKDARGARIRPLFRLPAPRSGRHLQL